MSYSETPITKTFVCYLPKRNYRVIHKVCRRCGDIPEDDDMHCLPCDAEVRKEKMKVPTTK